jgi:hypothetical protein
VNSVADAAKPVLTAGINPAATLRYEAGGGQQMKPDTPQEQRAASHGRTYVIVWIALLVLTAVTVTVAELHLGRFSTVTTVIHNGKSKPRVTFFMLQCEACSRSCSSCPC